MISVSFCSPYKNGMTGAQRRECSCEWRGLGEPESIFMRKAISVKGLGVGMIASALLCDDQTRNAGLDSVGEHNKQRKRVAFTRLK